MMDDTGSSRGRAAVADTGARASSGETPVAADAIEKKFLALVLLWKQTQGPHSSVISLVTHPAYQRIIGLGPAAVPLLLRELERESDHWFWALNAVTGEDPVAAEDRGDVGRMREAWLEWGRENGLL